MKIDPWQQQLNNRLTTVKDIFEFRVWPYSEDEIVKSSSLSMFTTPYYASLIEKADYSDPIFAMTVPSPEEAKSEQNSCDPLEEEKYMPVPGLIRRYPDRAVYTATLNCASRCRHCTRR